jgi:hypothetical protein
MCATQKNFGVSLKGGGVRLENISGSLSWRKMLDLENFGVFFIGGDVGISVWLYVCKTTRKSNTKKPLRGVRLWNDKKLR